MSADTVTMILGLGFLVPLMIVLWTMCTYAIYYVLQNILKDHRERRDRRDRG